MTRITKIVRFPEYLICHNPYLIYMVNLSVERCHPPGPSFPKPCEQGIVYQTDKWGCWDTDEMVFPVSQWGIRLWIAPSVPPLLTARWKDLNKGQCLGRNHSNQHSQQLLVTCWTVITQAHHTSWAEVWVWDLQKAANILGVSQL